MAASAGGTPRGRGMPLPNAAEPGLTDADVLLLAVEHAVAAVGGLGGMVHLRGPAPLAGLRLSVSSGLPHAFTRDWDGVAAGEEVPPAQAVADGALAWARNVPDRSRTPTAAVRALPAGAGMVSAPLPAPGAPAGALTVVLADLEGEPGEPLRAVLTRVAEWAARRLRQIAPGEGLPFTGSRPPTDEGVREAMEAVGVGAWEWDLRTGEVAWNLAMPTVLGLDPETFDGRIESWVDLVHPEDLPGVMTAIEQAVRARGAFDREYRVRRPDGGTGWVQSRGRVLTDGRGEPVRVLGALWDTTRAHAALESVGRALRHMTDGFLAIGRDWRVTFGNDRAERLLGSPHQLTGRVLWELPAVQRVPGLVTRCRQAAERGEPSEFAARWPGTGRWIQLRLVPVPDGLTLYLTDVTGKRRREAERQAAEEAAAERATRIKQLTAALSQALTAREVVTVLADRVLPPFGASALIVSVVEEGRLHVVHAVGYSPEFLRELDDVPLETAVAIAEGFRSGAPTFVSSPEEFLARFPTAALLLLRLSGKRSWAFLPLIASGQAVGSCVISFDQPRRLTGEERTLLVAISGLLAQALERARLYDVEHQRARDLQRGLLPQALPSVPAVTTAARYLPSGPGAEAGGDWYDVIPLSADRVALVIGDVMGHGLSEAATMGRLRTAVQTLSDLELPPDEILGRLNEIVSGLGDDFYATCLYAVYDPATRRCVFARAGHPPPAVVHPDGSVHLPDLEPNAPLGAADPPFDTRELELPDGSLLVLYTDGLVESEERDIDQGMARLSVAITEAHRSGHAARPEALCESLTGALVPARQQTSDDAALLVARTHWLTPENVASWALPEDPVAAGQAREHVREQLARWHLGELTMTTELVASELVSNVILHASGPIRLRLLRSRSLICEVSDGSHTAPHMRRASVTDEGGRGLRLVAALSQRWGTRFTPEGKSIWTEQALPGPQ